MRKNDGRRSRPHLLLVGGLFLITRLFVIPFVPIFDQQPGSDVEKIYGEYAAEFEAASQRGVPFYEFHLWAVEQKAEAARVAGTLVGTIEEHKDVEYPPLALAVMRLPSFVVPNGIGGWPPDATCLRSYRSFYRLLMAVVDVALFVLLILLVHRLFPYENAMDQMQRLLVYVAATAVLWHQLYDRLDLLLALLIMLAMALLISRLHYAWSFAVLAVAINFKLVPLVLAPVWVIGSLAAEQTSGESHTAARLRVLLALGGRAALLMAMILACFLPFYLSAGNRCLGFFAYHKGRGLEIGSVLGSVPLAQLALGCPISVDSSYGSINLRSSLSPVLAALAPWLTAGFLLAAIALLCVHFLRLTRRPSGGLPVRGTLAQRNPGTVVCYTLLFLMLFIAVNKVFSPQYLLWLAPLACLIPFEPHGRRLFTWTFLTICVLSTVLFPFLFLLDLLVDPTAPPTVPPTYGVPTGRLAAIMVIRNLLFVVLTGGLVWRVVAFARAAGCENGTKPALPLS